MVEHENKGFQIYSRISELAKQQKKSIRTVAEKAGFRTPSTIYNYRYGAQPGDVSLKAIAEVLKTTPEYLKGETDNPSPDGKTAAERAADLASPILAYDGRVIPSNQAEKIRDFTEYLMTKEKQKQEQSDNSD